MQHGAGYQGGGGTVLALWDGARAGPGRGPGRVRGACVVRAPSHPSRLSRLVAHVRARAVSLPTTALPVYPPVKYLRSYAFSWLFALYGTTTSALVSPRPASAVRGQALRGQASSRGDTTSTIGVSLRAVVVRLLG